MSKTARKTPKLKKPGGSSDAAARNTKALKAHTIRVPHKAISTVSGWLSNSVEADSDPDFRELAASAYEALVALTPVIWNRELGRVKIRGNRSSRRWGGGQGYVM
jgi:hypothetical protein